MVIKIFKLWSLKVFGPNIWMLWWKCNASNTISSFLLSNLLHNEVNYLWRSIFTVQGQCLEYLIYITLYERLSNISWNQWQEYALDNCFLYADMSYNCKLYCSMQCCAVILAESCKCCCMVNNFFSAMLYYNFKLYCIAVLWFEQKVEIVIIRIAMEKNKIFSTLEDSCINDLNPLCVAIIRMARWIAETFSFWDRYNKLVIIWLIQFFLVGITR